MLISQHDFVPLFAHLVKTISTLDFSVSPTLIESACSNIAAWAGPEVGLQELPFLGSLLDVHMYAIRALCVSLFVLNYNFQTTASFVSPARACHRESFEDGH